MKALEPIDAYPTERIAGFPVRAGRALPFGATQVPGGVNFSIYSNHATAMTLVLYRAGEREPMVELPFPESFRVGGVYAMTVFDLDVEGIEYGYRADGPYDPARGHRFDGSRVLADPYAKLITGMGPYRNRSRVVLDDFDWEGDRPPRLAHEDLVIYETHVRGFTRDPSSGVSVPGTYAGLVEKIPYLLELGVNCVELMPVFEFDESDNTFTGVNYWGYNPLGFFAPKASYAATGRYHMQVDEFKHMVKELHKAGIEVLLDVVFNHTGEGDERGPSITFKGLDNATYYMITPDGYYYNFSGTGNTLNCNHPVVRGFVLDCLRYWAAEFRVDGFRFDLAAILGRGEGGELLHNPPLLESLAYDPILRDCKLIAEAWDAAGLYQVGSFPDYCRWSEWNGRYRDTVRRFLKGDVGMAGDLATRLVGSPDMYGHRGTSATVNFVTSHDGFTLRDLVSYDSKHNEANGERNGDGDGTNHSWNCGHEGETDDPGVLAIRARQTRNALLILLASRGVPMLLAGDEVGRTQYGNNNAYCHDSPLTWFDWRLVEDNADLFHFVRRVLAFRRAHPVLRYGAPGAPGALTWHGVRAWSPDWSPHCRLVAAMLDGGGEDCVYIAANSHWEGHTLDLPAPPRGLSWHLFADTTAASPMDAYDPGDEPPLADQSQVRVGPRSVLILVTYKREES
ncbi:glycogen debranching protein [Streptosporangium subroseum]|uniref:glycogen debranching protein n=1 Tax=Streptosporangium subroseum TaxID=106412 RepID=UPI0030893062|nr:isoamylase [Streptosporangium subroseum]